MKPTIVHNNLLNRFEILLDDDLAVLDYELEGSSLALVHTYVPPEFRKQGLAYALVEAAIKYAKKEKLHVIPYCSTAVKYMMEHPEKESE